MFEGSTRQTYVGDDWVYKVPTCIYGERQNELEADTYVGYLNDEPVIPIAECYLLHDGTLKMRRVYTIKNLEGEPDVWMPHDEIVEICDTWERTLGWSVDSQQIGYDHTGNIVAYDI
jgi:hypothetical protein